MRRVWKAAGLVALVAGLSAAFVPGAPAELTERGDLFVRFNGGIAPNSLPREKRAPISVNVEGTVKTLSGERPPALRQIKIELNRGGLISSKGLPVCSYRQLAATSPQAAMAVCGKALVGRGIYRANTAFPDQNAFPSDGKILAFNAVSQGQDAILAHVYGSVPIPTSRILVFRIHRSPGTFGTALTGALPFSVNAYGYVKSIGLRLFRRYTYRGEPRSYISAACPAPAGFYTAFFPFARTSMTFADGRTLSSTLTRGCAVDRGAER